MADVEDEEPGDELARGESPLDLLLAQEAAERAASPPQSSEAGRAAGLERRGLSTGAVLGAIGGRLWGAARWALDDAVPDLNEYTRDDWH